MQIRSSSRDQRVSGRRSRCPMSMRFSQRLSRDHLVPELDEDEAGLGDVAHLARAEHDALEGATSLGHQGEARSPRQRSERSSVLRVRVSRSAPPPLGSSPGRDCRSRAFVAGPGQHRQVLQDGRKTARTSSGAAVMSRTPLGRTAETDSGMPPG